MEKLLTKKDLAARWQVSERTIDLWLKSGQISRAKRIPSVRFTKQHIQELEGTKKDRFSPLERKRLESELSEAKERIKLLESIVQNVLAETSKIINQ